MHGEVSEWIQRFLEARAGQGLSPVTVERDRWVLERFARWMGPRRTRWLQLAPTCLSGYVADLRGRRSEWGRRRGEPLMPASVYQELRALKAFFRYLTECDVLLFNPARDIRSRATHTVCGRGVFSPGEISLLFAHLSGEDPLDLRDLAIFALLYGVGLRKGEAIGLDLADYDPDDGLVWVRWAKGGKARLLPLGPATNRDLREYVRSGRPRLMGAVGSPALFLNCQGQRIGVDLINARLAIVEARAGVRPPRGPHALRHAFATHMLREGADISVLQRFLGHTRVGTTAVYLDVDLEDLREALTQAHPREREDW